MRLTSCGWRDDVFDFADRIGGETTFLGMSSNQLFTWSVIDTIYFVSGDVTVLPLNFRPQFFEDGTRVLGNSLKVVG